MAYSEVEIERARKIATAIEAYSLRPKGRSRTSAANVAASLNVSVASFYRYLNRFTESGLMGLLPQRLIHARRRRSTPEAVETIIATSIRDVYMSARRRTPRALYDSISSRCKAAGLRPPHKNTIRNRLKEIPPQELYRTRYGSKQAQDLDPAAGTYDEAQWPLSVIQIDHTEADVLLVEEATREVLGRPYLTLVLDLYSRLILGFYLSLDAPSSLSVGLALVHAILPKHEQLRALGSEVTWGCYGLPYVVHTDNAMEFRGKALRSACAKWGIDIQFRPAGRPRFGGHIERAIRTINEALHNLPGTTFSNTRQKGKSSPERSAAMTLRELQAWLTIHIAGRYNHQLHSGIDMSPARKWDEGLTASLRALGQTRHVPQSSEKQLLIDFLPFEERTIQRDGISWDNVTYYDKCLDPWIAETVARRKEHKYVRRVTVKRDPRAISPIYLYDKESDTYRDIHYANATRPVISIWELRAARKRAKTARRGDADEDIIFKAYSDLMRIEDEAETKTAKARRSRERRLHHSEVSPKPTSPPLPQKLPYDPQSIRPFDDTEN